jgi:anti-sigma factor RsiW/DNA-binding transcriptional regulator YhcF (GntR family)
MVQTMHPFEQEEIMAYLDGEVSADRASVVAAHLHECAECEALAESLRGVSKQLTAWTVEPAPGSLTQLAATAVEERPAQALSKKAPGQQFLERIRRLRPRQLAWSAAGAVAVVLVLVLMTAPLRHEVVDYWMAPASMEESYSGHPVAPASPPQPPLRKALAAGGEYKRSLSEDASNLEGGPLIAKTASLSIVVKDFGTIEAVVKAISNRHEGYIAELNATTPRESARTLAATLKIPAPQLDAALAELKQLGRVEQEQQSGEEVTKQYTDLAARLKNLRATEERLLAVLRDHTGKVKDILEVEQEVARVRGEIEGMEADQRTLQKRIDFATVQLFMKEDYKASLQVAPSSTPTRLHNAAVEGFRGVADGAIDLILWLLEFGPSLLLWGAILFFPARWAWKRFRQALTAEDQLPVKS